jgi:O-antigen/teichoic acid export membrane protein
VTTDNPISANDAANNHRKQRLRYAFFTGITAKILAIAVQWIALPLSLKALGTDRYAAFLALQALVAWSGLLAMGLVPSLPRFLSEAVMSGARAIERNIFQTAVIYLSAICALFAAFMLLLGFIVPPSQMVAVHGIASEEIFFAYVAVVATASFQLTCSIMPAIRSGFQELHYSYVWATISSILVMLGLFYLSSGKPTIAAFILIIYTPPAAMALLDMGLLCFQRPYLLQGRADFLETAKRLAPQATNALVGQFAYFLVSFVPTLIVAHLNGPAATAAFGSIMRLLILGSSGLNLIYQPLVPAIANAYAHRDRAWLKKAYLRATALVILICGSALLVDIFAGSLLLHKWLGASLQIPAALPIIMGFYFFIWSINVLHFFILAATGHLDGVGRSYFIEGTLAVTLGATLTHFFGVNGMATGLLIATAGVNFWFLPLRVWRHMIKDIPAASELK